MEEGQALSKAPVEVDAVGGEGFTLVVGGGKLCKDGKSLQFRVGLALDGKVVWWTLGWRICNGTMTFPARKTGNVFYAMHELPDKRTYGYILKLVKFAYESKREFRDVHFPKVYEEGEEND